MREETYQVLGHRRRYMPISLTLPRHPIHLPLTQLLRALCLGPGNLIRNTVIASIALASRSALSAHLGFIIRVIELHCVFSACTTAQWSAAARLRASAGDEGSGVEAELVEVVFHLCELLTG